MQTIYLVTGNPNKLSELRAIFPAEAALEHASLDIQEIQGEPDEIIRDKLQKAYTLQKLPVIVEDVSAELACHNGLPGPYIKHYEKKLGKGALWKLAQAEADKALTIRCLMGYFDGQDMKIVEGVVSGTVVAPRGENGFGFDFVFMPEGYAQTTAEMTSEEKNAISWRGIAARKLVRELFR